MRILEEVYEMPGCPEEMEKKCEIWREVKRSKWLKLKLCMGQSRCFAVSLGGVLIFLPTFSLSMIINSLLKREEHSNRD
jgi:hypothetical protein